MDSYSMNQIINVPSMSSVQAAQISYDESLIVAGLQNGNIVVYARQMTGYQPIQTITGAHQGGVTALAVSNDGSKLATVGADGTTAFWAREPTTNNQGNFTLRKRNQENASSVAFDRRNALAIGMQSMMNGQSKVYSVVTNCTQILNSSGIVTNGVDCLCKAGFVWYDGSCQVLNCSRLAYGLATDKVVGTCTCQAGFTFQDGLCKRDCSIVQNSLGITDGVEICMCLPNFEWNGLFCDAGVLASTTIITTTTTTTTTSTGGTTATSTDTGPVDCVKVKNALYNINPNLCYCFPGYIFSNRQCNLNCTNISKASSNPNPTPDSCACVTGYVWKDKDCVLAPLTTIVPGPNGGVVVVTNQTSVSTITVIDCSNVPNSPKKSNGPDSCLCNDGYYWNKTACYLNCSNVPNSNGQNFGIDGCQCNNNMKWNGMQCVSSNVNVVVITDVKNVSTLVCNSIPNSDGVDLGGNMCRCNQGFYWSNSKCLRNCSLVKNSTNVSTPAGDGCLCIPTYTWNGAMCAPPALRILNITTLPGINCMDIPNGAGFTATPGLCKCITGYIWNNTDCVRNCSAVANSNGTTTNNTCACNLGFVWSTDK